MPVATGFSMGFVLFLTCLLIRIDVSPVLVVESLSSIDFKKRMESRAPPGYVFERVAGNCQTVGISFTKSFGVFA